MAEMKSLRDVIQRTKAFLFGRQRAYRMVFGGPVGQAVLVDLAKFCHAHKPCFHPDPRLHAVLEGRREVWLRIQHHLNLSPEQLWDLYTQAQQQESQ